MRRTLIVSAIGVIALLLSLSFVLTINLINIEIACSDSSITASETHAS